MRSLKIDYRITRRDSDSFDKYLRDISKIPLLTKEEEVAVAKEIRLGKEATEVAKMSEFREQSEEVKVENTNRIRQGEEALNIMVQSNLRFVVSVAKQYQNYGVPISDLISDGNQGLIEAAKRFDHTKGFKFISYAVWWIRQKIQAGISSQSRVVRFPQNCEDGILEYNKKEQELAQELDREPTFEEVFKRLTDDSKRAKMVLQGGQERHKSLDASVTSDEGGATLLDLMENVANVNIEAEADKEYVTQSILKALDSLPSLEKYVIKARFGMNGEDEKSYDEIGESIGKTGERVRQITFKALTRLRRNPKTKKILADLSR